MVFKAHAHISNVPGRPALNNTATIYIKQQKMLKPYSVIVEFVSQILYSKMYFKILQTLMKNLSPQFSEMAPSFFRNSLENHGEC